MIGISEDTFWKQTPYKTKLHMQAFQERWKMQHNHDAWMMWHGALLSIPVKGKPTPLKNFLVTDDKKEVKLIDESAILTRFKRYNERVVDNGESS